MTLRSPNLILLKIPKQIAHHGPLWTWSDGRRWVASPRTMKSNGDSGNCWHFDRFLMESQPFTNSPYVLWRSLMIHLLYKYSRQTLDNHEVAGISKFIESAQNGLQLQTLRVKTTWDVSSNHALDYFINLILSRPLHILDQSILINICLNWICHNYSTIIQLWVTSKSRMKKQSFLWQTDPSDYISRHFLLSVIIYEYRRDRHRVILKYPDRY